MGPNPQFPGKLHFFIQWTDVCENGFSHGPFF